MSFLLGEKKKDSVITWIKCFNDSPQEDCMICGQTRDAKMRISQLGKDMPKYFSRRGGRHWTWPLDVLLVFIPFKQSEKSIPQIKGWDHLKLIWNLFSVFEDTVCNRGLLTAPSYLCVSILISLYECCAVLSLVLSHVWLCDPMDCSPPGSSVHGDSPDKNTGVGYHALLQGIFPTQGSNPGLPHCRWFFTIWAMRATWVEIYRPPLIKHK